MKINKNIVLLLMVLLAAFWFVEGCGCSKKTEEGAEGEQPAAEGEQPAEGDQPPQEAARTNAPPPPAAAPPAAAPPAAAKKPDDKNAPKPLVVKKQVVPDNKFLSIEFDTKEAMLLPTFQLYASRVRRNIFRDIKKSVKLMKDAGIAIEQGKKMIEKVKGMPAGTYTGDLLKQAEENMKQAEDAYKGQNYLKARALADKASELAFDSIPKTVGQSTERPSIEYYYKGFYSMGDERTAMITKKDPDSGTEKLMTVRIGDIVSDNLPSPISIEGPDGMQIKVSKIDYQIEDINEDSLVITNITEKKPAMKLPISQPNTGTTTATTSDKDKKKDSKDSGSSQTKSGTTTTSTTTSGSTFTSNSSSSTSSGTGTGMTFTTTTTPK